jgi:hypothetical protein
MPNETTKTYEFGRYVGGRSRAEGGRVHATSEADAREKVWRLFAHDAAPQEMQVTQFALTSVRDLDHAFGNHPPAPVAVAPGGQTPSPDEAR